MPDPEDTRLRARLGWVTAVAVLAAVGVAALGLAEAHRRDEAIVAVEPPLPEPPARLTALGTDASPVAWRIRPTGEPAVDDVVRAYQRYLGTTVRLAEKPDPADPAVPVIATGARRAELVRFLVAAVNVRGFTRGPVAASATVLASGPTAVTLLGCTDYTRQRTMTSGGATAGGTVAATVQLRREDAVWKVASSVRTAASRCR